MYSGIDSAAELLRLFSGPGVEERWRRAFGVKIRGADAAPTPGDGGTALCIGIGFWFTVRLSALEAIEPPGDTGPLTLGEGPE